MSTRQERQTESIRRLAQNWDDGRLAFEIRNTRSRLNSAMGPGRAQSLDRRLRALETEQQRREEETA